MFLVSQPEWHLPWLGVAGWLLSPGNAFAAMETAGRNCMPSPFLAFWPIEIVWVIAALWCLTSVSYTLKHRWYRLGLAVGLGTWLSPIANVVLFR